MMISGESMLKSPLLLFSLFACLLLGQVAEARGGRGGGGRASHSGGGHSGGHSRSSGKSGGHSHTAGKSVKKGSHVQVKSYTTKNGKHVNGHKRTNPDKAKSNNWSTRGNVNPYTGKEGTKEP